MKRFILLSLFAVSVAFPAPLLNADEKPCPKEVKRCLMETPKELESRGWLGFGFYIENEKAMEEPSILRVNVVSPGGPAEKAGLKLDDRIIAISGKVIELKKEEDVLAFFKQIEPGERLDLTVMRKGEELLIELIPVAPPPEIVRAWLGLHMRVHHGAKPQR